MNRNEAEKLLAAFIFDDLDEASKADLAAYLQSDKELSEHLADMRMAVKVTSDALQQAPEPVLSKRRLKNLAKLTERKRRPAFSTMRYMAAAAAILVAVILPSYLIFSRSANLDSMKPGDEFAGGAKVQALADQVSASGDYGITTEESLEGEELYAAAEPGRNEIIRRELGFDNAWEYKNRSNNDVNGKKLNDQIDACMDKQVQFGSGAHGNGAMHGDPTVAYVTTRIVDNGGKVYVNEFNKQINKSGYDDIVVHNRGRQPANTSTVTAGAPNKSVNMIGMDNSNIDFIYFDNAQSADDNSSRQNGITIEDIVAGAAPQKESSSPGVVSTTSGSVAAKDRYALRESELKMLAKKVRSFDEGGEEQFEPAKNRQYILRKLTQPVDIRPETSKTPSGQPSRPLSGPVTAEPEPVELDGSVYWSAEVNRPEDELRDEVKPKTESNGSRTFQKLKSGKKDEGKGGKFNVIDGDRKHDAGSFQRLRSLEYAADEKNEAGVNNLEMKLHKDTTDAYTVTAQDKIKSSGAGGKKTTVDRDEKYPVSTTSDTRPIDSFAWTYDDAAIINERDEIRKTKEFSMKGFMPKQDKILGGPVSKDISATGSLLGSEDKKPAVGADDARSKSAEIASSDESAQKIVAGLTRPPEPGVKIVDREDSKDGNYDESVAGHYTYDGEDESDLPLGSRFKLVPVNPWVMSEKDRLSTFALDVDTASYTLCRRYINNGYLPPAGAVRMEEFINYFNYHYPQRADHTFTVHAEAAASPFADDGKNLTLLKIGVKARTIGRDQQKAAHLIIVVDASASMGRPDRLGLVQQALNLLIDKLSDADRVTLITCSNESRLHLEAVSLRQRDKIRQVINAVQPSGHTNLLAGLKLGYAFARRSFDPKQINHVVLCSDGVANVGHTEAELVLKEVAADRKQGVTITCVGVGYGSYNDAFLESLANRGDGSYVFLDSTRQAQRVFVEQLAATLHVVAKDARIQVSFNPERVRRYRLIGYENRDIEDKRFRDDTVDAGEVGSGQCSTALYELELTGQRSAEQGEGLGTVFVRYRNADSGRMEEISRSLKDSIVQKHKVSSSPRFFLAAAASRFAEILRQSEHARQGSLKEALIIAEKISLALPLDRDVRELAELIRKAEHLPRAQ